MRVNYKHQVWCTYCGESRGRRTCISRLNHLWCRYCNKMCREKPKNDKAQKVYI